MDPLIVRVSMNQLQVLLAIRVEDLKIISVEGQNAPQHTLPLQGCTEFLKKAR